MLGLGEAPGAQREQTGRAKADGDCVAVRRAIAARKLDGVCEGVTEVEGFARASL